MRHGVLPFQNALESRLKPQKLQDLIDGVDPAGRWSIGPGHEVSYRSADSRRGEQTRLTLTPVAAEAGTLVVSLAQKAASGRQVTRLVRVDGRWSLDGRNRITFETDHASGPSRKWVFGGSWELDEAHRVSYRLERRPLRRRIRLDRRLVFEGRWDVGPDNRLVYRLGGGPGGEFRVRGAFQTGSVLAKRGEIRYQAGVEIAGTRRARTLTLYGRWLVSRDFGLTFEIKGGGRSSAITFGGNARLGPKGRVVVELTGRRGKPLGFEVILTRDVFRDGSVFARWVRSLEEARAEAGIRVVW